MPQPPKTDAEMAAFWNGETGERWVADQEEMDELLAPFGLALLKAAHPAAGEHALDVGCGCGDTTLALAGAVAPGGRATGVDVSAPMLARARARAEAHPREVTATFLQADAGSAALPGAPFDLMISRFGVMFFEHPARAFAHLRAALKQGGRIAFVCWRTMPENPWMSVPLAAALPHVPPPPRPDPHAPGPFAFGDPARVKGILETAGFGDVALTPFDAPMILGATAAEAARRAAERGPIAALLADATEAQRTAALAAVAAAFAPYAGDDGVALTGAAWVVTARG